MFDTTKWYANARRHTTHEVADSLAVIAIGGWGNKSFEIANGQGETELEVTLITIDDVDLRDAPGTLYDAFSDEVEPMPAVGSYIVTRNSDGVPTGYEYATEAEAKRDYDYLRSRY
jgi:hypothetical protein